MRVLWAKANKILPVSSGGDIRSFHLLRQLSASDQVAFFSYYVGPVDRQYEGELERRLPGCICVCTGRKGGASVARGMDYLWRLPQSAPYAVSRFASSRVRSLLSRAIRETRPDLVVCDFLDAAINLPAHLDVPCVLFQHNVESEIWRRHAEMASNPLKKQLYKVEYAKMLRYEKDAVSRFDRVIAVSAHDRALMSRWVDSSRIDVVPTGVDLSELQSREASDSNRPLVVFVGAMDWEPNIDAVEYFCASLWPGILAKIPEARFQIVGRNPGQRVRKLQSANVEVTGSVPSVVTHLREAAVVVVPLRVGGGTRLKIYEAMAAGKSVVSTTIGAEGLDVNPGKDIWIADEPRAMAEAVIQLLKGRELRQKMGRAAAEQAAKFDWARVAVSFRESLRKAAEVGNAAHADDESATPMLSSSLR